MHVEELMQILSQYLFSLCGNGKIILTRLCGDASNRTYYRCSINGHSFIVMQLGNNPLLSEEVSSPSKSEELPFINVQRFLANGGLPVPKIHKVFRNAGLILLEDLGDQTLESVVINLTAKDREQYYQSVIHELIAFQNYANSHNSKCNCICFNRV